MSAPGAGGTPRAGNTPRRLTSLMVLATLVLVVLGSALGFFLLTAGHDAEGPRADQRSAQLAEIEVSLLTIDDLAVQWTLKPSAGRRTSFVDAVNQATVLLTRAAADQPSSVEGISAIQRAVGKHSAAIHESWSSNSAGTLAELQRARSALQTDALEPLRKLPTQSSGSSSLLWWVTGACVAAVAALIWISIPLARSTHRYLNPGLLGAILSVLLLWLAASTALSAMAPATSASTELGTLIAARTAAREALTEEHLGLALKGDAVSQETAWKAAMTRVSQGAALRDDDPATEAALASIFSAHEAVRKLAEAKSWAAATERSLDTSEKGSVGATDALDDSLSTEIGDRLASDASPSPALAVNLALIAFVVVAFLGVACAVWGINQRLREYR
ncbi:MAG: hypothetical protein WAS07_13595 [Micropruina sp.]|nr:hypothetical protein [Micropruina sp.]